MTHPQPEGFLAFPTSGSGPGVLVLHAWWGLNDTIKAFCTRLAQEGFAAMAPDLFAGTIARTIEEAEQHQSQWNEAQEVPPILLPAVDDFTKHPAVTGHGLAVVGFSLGGYWALWLAQNKPKLIRSVALFYGTNGGGGNFQQSKADYLGHFAENDPYEPPANVDELEESLRRAGRSVTFYRYPGTGHWFFEPDRPQAYDLEAASLAWDRTLYFLRSEGKDRMYDKPLTIEQMLTMLAATPSRLAGLTQGLPPAQLLAPLEPGEWSARDVLAHLRACSDMWGKYIEVILNEDRPTFKAINPTTWIKQTNYLELEFQPSLEAFTTQRAGLMEVLKPLAPGAWSRTATVTGAGKPRERTVYTYAQWLANHEHSHIKQLERIVDTMRR